MSDNQKVRTYFNQVKRVGLTLWVAAGGEPEKYKGQMFSDAMLALKAGMVLPPEGQTYPIEVHTLADFRRWLLGYQPPPDAGTDYIHWLNPKGVLEMFDQAMPEGCVVVERARLERLSDAEPRGDDTAWTFAERQAAEIRAMLAAAPSVGEGG